MAGMVERSTEARKVLRELDAEHHQLDCRLRRGSFHSTWSLPKHSEALADVALGRPDGVALTYRTRPTGCGSNCRSDLWLWTTRSAGSEIPFRQRHAR
jgi:hypothetical protein